LTPSTSAAIAINALSFEASRVSKTAISARKIALSLLWACEVVERKIEFP